MGAIYDITAAEFARGRIDWGVQSLVLALTSVAYTPSYAAEKHVIDLPTGVVMTPFYPLFAPVVRSDGVCQVNRAILPGVTTTGPIKGALIAFDDGGGDSSTFQLACFLDQGLGFGMWPEQEDISINWDANFGGVLKL
jgi:hypothetical protein